MTSMEKGVRVKGRVLSEGVRGSGLVGEFIFHCNSQMTSGLTAVSYKVKN
jgi:hypothetical protein